MVVAGFYEKPIHPAGISGETCRAYVSIGNYLFPSNTLVEVLNAAIRLGHTDFGTDILPRLAGQRRLFLPTISRATTFLA